MVILFNCAAASLEAKDLAYLFNRLEAEEGMVVAGEVAVDRVGEVKLLSMAPDAVPFDISLASSGKSPSLCLNSR